MQSKFGLIQLVSQSKLTFEAVRSKLKKLTLILSNFNNGILNTADVMVIQPWLDRCYTQKQNKLNFM